ncbi:hypothetical protein P3T76_005431 [Phytophthora citrophthora]|uniref:RxLR effector protein n=1 Tax=Phytophthora citrophthora TaxID=4793 RepID=A0AAD9GPV6_9STRA|nr:hypothetical protein P3T76_005431 [Phytophthora citrophthora]
MRWALVYMVSLALVTLNIETLGVVLPFKSTHDQRLLRTSTSTKTSTNDTEERAIDAAIIARLNDEWQAAVMRAAYAHWFEGGKTKADVRLIMGLPATGEAVGYANWTKYLKYLEFLKEKEVEAANIAAVTAYKWRRVYKDWFFGQKTFEDVRVILKIPLKGDHADHVNWEVFQNYLKFYKEFSQLFT